MKFRAVIVGAMVVMLFCMLRGECFEIKGQIRYNSNQRIMPITKESEEPQEKQAKEALARKDTPYNICMAIFFGAAVVVMIILILTAPKNKDKGE